MNFRRNLHRLNNWWLHYEYKHTTLAILAIILFILLLDSALLAGVFGFVQSLGYVGGVVAGMLSVSFFTTLPAVVVIVSLAPQLDPFLLALAATVGSTLGDWLLLRFYEERVFHELRPLLRRLKLKVMMRLLRHRYTSWILFLFGAFFIASPLPDEIGIGLMGISHFKRPVIVAVCFVLNGIGTLLLILAVRAVVQ